MTARPSIPTSLGSRARAVATESTRVRTRVIICAVPEARAARVVPKRSAWVLSVCGFLLSAEWYFIRRFRMIGRLSRLSTESTFLFVVRVRSVVVIIGAVTLRVHLVEHHSENLRARDR